MFPIPQLCPICRRPLKSTFTSASLEAVCEGHPQRDGLTLLALADAQQWTTPRRHSDDEAPLGNPKRMCLPAAAQTSPFPTTFPVQAAAAASLASPGAASLSWGSTARADTGDIETYTCDQWVDFAQIITKHWIANFFSQMYLNKTKRHEVHYETFKKFKAILPDALNAAISRKIAEKATLLKNTAALIAEKLLEPCTVTEITVDINIALYALHHLIFYFIYNQSQLDRVYHPEIFQLLKEIKQEHLVAFFDYTIKQKYTKNIHHFDLLKNFSMKDSNQWMVLLNRLQSCLMTSSLGSPELSVWLSTHITESQMITYYLANTNFRNETLDNFLNEILDSWMPNIAKKMGQNSKFNTAIRDSKEMLIGSCFAIFPEPFKGSMVVFLLTKSDMDCVKIKKILWSMAHPIPFIPSEKVINIFYDFANYFFCCQQRGLKYFANLKEICQKNIYTLLLALERSYLIELVKYSANKSPRPQYLPESCRYASNFLLAEELKRRIESLSISSMSAAQP